jgi:5-methyltetrahydrofolate--homocysteine methyltransferase
MKAMEDLLNQIANCIEIGKAELNSQYPPDMKGKDGAYELTQQALDSKIHPEVILKEGFMIGMTKIGDKFGKGTAFIPNLLLSAAAMNKAMELLQPFFESGEAKLIGTLVLGTVKGDLHDIGKNLVKMVMKGDGWNVIDLGVRVESRQFLDEIKNHDKCIVGLSALLTTTMINMEEIIKDIKNEYDGTEVFVGGAALSRQFAEKIGADGYFPDPHSFSKHFHK